MVLFNHDIVDSMRILSLGRGAACSLLVVTLLACNAEQEAISQVTKPRVLAIQAEPPEIVAGEASTVRLLLADETGPIEAGAEVAWIVLTGDFMAVPDPSVPGSDITRAVADLRPGLEVALGGDTLTVTARDDAREGLESSEDGKLTVFALVCARGALPGTTEALLGRILDLFSGDLDDYNGICDGDGTGIVALKQITVSRPDKPVADINHNPTIHSLLVNNQEIAPDLGDQVQAEYLCEGADGCREEVDVVLTLTAQSYETFASASVDQRIDEVVYVSWFITGGKMSVDRSGVAGPPAADDPTWGPFDASWFPPRIGGEIDLWAVAHDVRGGVSWWKARIQAMSQVAQ